MAGGLSFSPCQPRLSLSLYVDSHPSRDRNRIIIIGILFGSAFFSLSAGQCLIASIFTDGVLINLSEL